MALLTLATSFVVASAALLLPRAPAPRCCAAQSAPSATALRTQLESGVLLVDRSAWGTIGVTGADALRFLHGQSTNRFEKREPLTVLDTTITTATGRVRDLVTAAITSAESVQLVTSPGAAAKLAQTLDMFVFPADQVAVSDESASTAIFTLLGSRERLAAALSAATLEAPEPGRACALAGGGWALDGSGVAAAGVTLLLPSERAASACRSFVVSCAAAGVGEIATSLVRVCMFATDPSRAR